MDKRQKKQKQKQTPGLPAGHLVLIDEDLTITARPCVAPSEAFDLVTEAISQPPTKRHKEAEVSPNIEGAAQEENMIVSKDMVAEMTAIKIFVEETADQLSEIHDIDAVTAEVLQRGVDNVVLRLTALKQGLNTIIASIAKSKPTFVDASTDTLLTPSWWDSVETDEVKAARKRKRRRRARIVSREVPDSEGDTAIDTDAPASWSTVARRPPRRRTEVTLPPQLPPPGTHTRAPKATSKPPAVLIRPALGKTFADTVRAVRGSGLSADEMGASVKMRETRDGALLLELPGGAKSSAAAKSIASALGAKLGDSVGKVSPLGVQVEVEILDLDAVSSAAEVREALRAAVPGGDDPAAKAERDNITDIQIWPVRGGQQVATAKVSRFVAANVSRIAVGWTMCRVRRRTPPPERCFRCQAFGHNARGCQADADRSGACWKCGEQGHPMKDCKAVGDRCLACEMAGLAMTSHRPGSGACAARRQARRST